MPRLEVIAVGVRLLGIFLFVFLLRDMSLVIDALSQFKQANNNVTNGIALYAAITIVALLLSLYMIKFPISVSKMLSTKSRVQSPEINGNTEIFQTTGVLLLGVYILSWAIPDLINNIIHLWQIKEFMPTDTANIAYTWNSIITTLVELGIGIYCAINSHGLIRLIQKLRS